MFDITQEEDYRELTLEEQYLVNGGGAMDQRDQAAMADAQAKGDQATMDAIRAKYDTSKNDSTSGGKTSYGTGASGNPGAGSGNGLNGGKTSGGNKSESQGSGSHEEQYRNAPTKGQDLPSSAMEDLIGGKNPLKGRKSALTSAEQAEMARQDALLKKKTKNTVVWIVRNHDGLDNKFDASRFIIKDGKIEYQDVVGANCFKDYDGIKGSTTPDGIYYLSDKKLINQKDGTSDSKSYKNVLSLMTSDNNLSEKEKNNINIGDRLFHSDEKYNKATGTFKSYSDYNLPYGAGCMITHTQKAHEQMMGVLMDGVYNPNNIQVRIVSLSNLPGFN